MTWVRTAVARVRMTCFRESMTAVSRSSVPVILRQALAIMLAWPIIGCGTIVTLKCEGPAYWLSGPVFDLKSFVASGAELAEDLTSRPGELASDALSSSDGCATCCFGLALPVLYLIDTPLSVVGDTLYWGLVYPFAWLLGGDDPSARQS